MTKKITALIFAILTLTVFFSCKKKNPTNVAQQSVSQNPPTKTAVKLRHLNAETKEYLNGKNIALILGYGYNDEATITTLYQILDLNYGIEKEDFPALITLIVYPDDFMVGGKIRVSSLYNILEEKNLAGIITLGAPEGLCNAIAKLEDNTEDGILPYPVFALFPQDDILGSESTANFVLDYAQKLNNIDSEQTTFIPDFDSTPLILNSVQAMIELRSPLVIDKKLINFVQKLVGKQKTVAHYYDSETGLQSVNHFIFN